MSWTSPSRRTAGSARNAADHLVGLAKAPAVAAVRVMPRAHGVDPHAVATELVGRDPHQLVDRGLPRGVGGEVAGGEGRRGRRDGDERARPVADHRQARVLQREVDGSDVGVDLPAELVVVEQQHRPDRAAARYDDRDVEAALVVGRRVHGVAHRCPVERVAGRPGDLEPLVGQPGDGVAERALGPAHDGDVGAVAGEQPRRHRARCPSRHPPPSPAVPRVPCPRRLPSTARCRAGGARLEGVGNERTGPVAGRHRGGLPGTLAVDRRLLGEDPRRAPEEQLLAGSSGGGNPWRHDATLGHDGATAPVRVPTRDEGPPP